MNFLEWNLPYFFRRSNPSCDLAFWTDLSSSTKKSTADILKNDLERRITCKIVVIQNWCFLPNNLHCCSINKGLLNYQAAGYLFLRLRVSLLQPRNHRHPPARELIRVETSCFSYSTPNSPESLFHGFMLHLKDVQVVGTMSHRIIFLTGAPKADSLKLELDSHLLDNFQPSIAKFLGLTSQNASVPASTSDNTSWRLLPLKPGHLTTGYSQVHGWHGEYRNAEFLNTQELSFVSSGSDEVRHASQFSDAQSAADVLSQFYEESFAFHEDVPSSALPVPSQEDQDEPWAHSQTGASFATTESSSLDSDTALMPPPMIPRPQVPTSGHLSDLEDIPNAAYLHSIQPQTMTVNLIVGIISILPPRIVRTRRGADAEIVEILVGDESRSGFGVNFWLHPTNSGPGEAECRRILESLRLQDIVLFKNVSLGSFRGKVFGQSLRKDMTKIHLLYRNLLDRHDVGGCYSALDLTSGETKPPQIEKTRTVRDWVLRFVGGPAHQDPGERGKQIAGKWNAAKQVLPPDTQ